MHGKCKILKFKVVVLWVLKPCTMIGEYWDAHMCKCVTVLHAMYHFKSTTNNCEDSLMMAPMECPKHVAQSVLRLSVHSSARKVGFISWLCKEQAIQKHDMKLYYFTEVIFQHNPQYTNALVSSWYSFYIHCSWRSHIYHINSISSVFKVLLCTAQSVRKPLAQWG